MDWLRLAALSTVIAQVFPAQAQPVSPRTGLSTFLMNHRGAIYEREFGDRTAEEVRRLTAFDPGPGWTRLKDEEP